MRISGCGSDVCSSDLHLDVDPAEVGRRFEATGSLIGAIEALRGEGRSLELLDLTKPGPFDEFIAENELLDPTSSDDMFESLTERGLRKNWHLGRDWMGRHRPFRKSFVIAREAKNRKGGV